MPWDALNKIGRLIGTDVGGERVLSEWKFQNEPNTLYANEAI